MPGKRWVQREKESLIRQVKQGKRLPQIRISGRSPAAVNQQRQGLRNAGPLGEVPKRRLRLWTTKEIRSLRGYVNRFRLSAAQIARAGLLAGRGKDSISQQMRRQGLGDPKRQEASRSAHRLDAKEKAALERFLRTKGRKLANGEVAEKFEISPKTVTAYRRRLKLQLSWHEARSSERYRQRMEEFRRVFVRRLRTRWKEWRVKRRRRLINLQWRMKGQGISFPTRRCVICGESWLELKEFFPVTKRRRNETVTYTMSLTCRACRAEGKRKRSTAHAN